MKEKLDYSDITKNMISEISAIKGELRSEIILLQAHVEFMIDETIEILIETDALRGTKSRFDLKLKILEELDWLPKDFVKDLKALSTIRGFIAHRINVYDQKTSDDIENQFKQITIIGKADPGVFPKDEALQKHLRTISELYFQLLYSIYNEIYELKKNRSLKNPTISDNYHFSKNGDDITIRFDST